MAGGWRNFSCGKTLDHSSPGLIPGRSIDGSQFWPIFCRARGPASCPIRVSSVLSLITGKQLGNHWFATFRAVPGDSIPKINFRRKAK